MPWLMHLVAHDACFSPRSAVAQITAGVHDLTRDRLAARGHFHVAAGGVAGVHFMRHDPSGSQGQKRRNQIHSDAFHGRFSVLEYRSMPAASLCHIVCESRLGSAHGVPSRGLQTQCVTRRHRERGVVTAPGKPRAGGCRSGERERGARCRDPFRVARSDDAARRARPLVRARRRSHARLTMGPTRDPEGWASWRSFARIRRARRHAPGTASPWRARHAGDRTWLEPRPPCRDRGRSTDRRALPRHRRATQPEQTPHARAACYTGAMTCVERSCVVGCAPQE